MWTSAKLITPCGPALVEMLRGFENRQRVLSAKAKSQRLLSPTERLIVVEESAPSIQQLDEFGVESWSAQAPTFTLVKHRIEHPKSTFALACSLGFQEWYSSFDAPKAVRRFGELVDALECGMWLELTEANAFMLLYDLRGSVQLRQSDAERIMEFNRQSFEVSFGQLPASHYVELLVTNQIAIFGSVFS